MQTVLPLSYDTSVSKSQCLSILGSTGSIGRQTLELARECSYRVEALACNKNIDLLIRQIEEFKPRLVSVGDADTARELKERLKASSLTEKAPDIMYGRQGNCAVASCSGVDTVVAAIVGFAGLEAVLEAIALGRKIALANKETLVAAGELVMSQARRSGASIIPVDSEHSAVWQCLLGRPLNSWKRIFLSCSGGPFRGYSYEKLADVRLEDALKHPTWDMGAKITIDSATLMNKGLEIIEAYYLFETAVENIDVVIHPQSLIHSMLSFKDGSVMAVLGSPDMKQPIHQALAFPEILERDEVYSYDPFAPANAMISFERPDEAVFPSLRLAREAVQGGGLLPLAYNSANEAANLLFRRERISFVTIFDIVAKVLDGFHNLSDVKLASYDDMINVHEKIMRAVFESYAPEFGHSV
ncbi:MAG: 1-deoxy-D-xylulose-5-phosphate reductoisomerase [Clostridiaceae bacterium]|jgi:1-deoxy-D-xylulose-5-phosphate reductoisomerase|nr:1-deoxy-D-xylulose-5-phosphate reductoisomerase [Clostridiaceae bacterium]